MLLYFKKYKNSTQTTIKILYSLKDTVNEQVCKKSGMQIFMVEVACWLHGRSTEINSNQMKTLKIIIILDRK